jgi:glycolate oxidase FAD binding subunit
MDTDLDRGAETLAEKVRQAAADRTPLIINGSGSKAFYGRSTPGQARMLDVTGQNGIVSYEPTELVITAAAGTPLREIEATLAEGGQRLGFEPPHFGPEATLGGTIACGLSGPVRPYTGAARDFVLGVRIINGAGEILRFGGQVMKNVAGYDLSRLMAGSLGTLGVLLEVSLKVLPRPGAERTLVQAAGETEAIERFNTWAGRSYPLSGAVWDGEALYLRLSGADSAVASAVERIGGDTLPQRQAGSFWTGVREQTHSFFATDAPLWRLSVPPASGPLELPGRGLLDWGGAQRWLASDLPAESVFAAARALGGHATLFRNGDRRGKVFQPLQPALLQLHRRLKTSLDPQGILNPGRLYSEL